MGTMFTDDEFKTLKKDIYEMADEIAIKECGEAEVHLGKDSIDLIVYVNNSVVCMITFRKERYVSVTELEKFIKVIDILPIHCYSQTLKDIIYEYQKGDKENLYMDF